MVLTQINIKDNLWLKFRVYCIENKLKVNNALEQILEKVLK